MQTIHTNVILQLRSDYRYMIEREAMITPERFSFYAYAFDRASMKEPEYQLIRQNPKEFTDGRHVYPILKPAYRTDENRLGILSLIPKESPALLTGNPVCPKGANLTLATILH